MAGDPRPPARRPRKDGRRAPSPPKGAPRAAPPERDIGVEARVAAGVLLNAALARRNGLDEAMSRAEIAADAERATEQFLTLYGTGLIASGRDKTNA